MAPPKMSSRSLLVAGSFGAALPHVLLQFSQSPATSSAAWCWKVDASAEGGIIQNKDKKNWEPTHRWYDNKNKCCAEGETVDNPSHVCFQPDECAEYTDSFDNSLKDIPAGDPKRPTLCEGGADTDGADARLRPGGLSLLLGLSAGAAALLGRHRAPN